MARIPRETVDRILDTVRIEEVIGEFVVLKKSGGSLKGLSPFTQEKTPSFYVSPSKQIFKCFSSGKGGSAVTFLMEHEQYTYPEALRWLAKKYNVEIQEEEVSPEQQAQDTERESLQRVNDFAAAQFQTWMWEHPKGQAVGLAYFRERGFTDATLKTFQLGFHLEDRDALYQAALAKGYRPEYLEKVGLCFPRENGQWADRFFGRVMFPIFSQSGRVLGFGGRILRSDAKAAKYVNSPESDLYSKSKTLYGLYQARQSIVRENKCLLVEGYTDVLRLHQSGITHAVASSGTALTVDQIRLIRRYTDQVTVLYDGDAAGIRASFRGIDLLLEQGLKVRVLRFPDGEDPDSFARSLAPEDLKQYLKTHETDFIRFKAEVLASDAAEDPIKRAGLAKDVISSVARVQDLLLRDVYLRECAVVLSMDERVLNQELQLALTRLANEAQRASGATSYRDGLRVVRPDGPGSAGAATGSSSAPEVDPYADPSHFAPDYVDGGHALQVGAAGRPLAVESDLLKTLLNHGPQEVQWTDEAGQVQTDTVATLILEDLSTDALAFEYPVYQQMYETCLEAWRTGTVLTSAHFVRSEDPAWVAAATDLLAEAHSLANWKLRDVFVPEKEVYLASFVHQAVLRFKTVHLERLIQNATTSLESTSLPQERDEWVRQIMTYSALRNQINTELNRVV